VSGKLLNWLTDFLFNRIQAVRINNITSANIPVKSGVPQGSVLGSVLFLIFNLILLTSLALVSQVNYLPKMYKWYANINDVNDFVLLQEGLDALNAWSDLWQLPLSLQRGTILLRGRNNTVDDKHSGLNNSDFCCFITVIQSSLT